MFDFRREATAALVPGFLCLSGRRRPENVSILSSLVEKARVNVTVVDSLQASFSNIDPGNSKK